MLTVTTTSFATLYDLSSILISVMASGGEGLEIFNTLTVTWDIEKGKEMCFPLPLFFFLVLFHLSFPNQVLQAVLISLKTGSLGDRVDKV
jgi:hypothetical protein